jgi:hypothetical protein
MLALPMGEPGRDQCEYCWHYATGYWSAQWSVVDFREVLACDRHQRDAGRELELGLVDNEPVADLRWHAFYPDWMPEFLESIH